MEKIRTYLFLLVVLPVMAFAQEQPEDSLVRLHLRIWDLIYSNPDTALVLASQAKRIAAEREDLSQVARSELLSGIAYDVKSKYDSAMLFYHRGLKTAREASDTSLIASSLSNIGLTFWHVGSYYKALENLFSSMSYFESMKDASPNIASVFNNIGLIYSELKEYNKSIGYFRKASKLYVENNDLLGLGATLTNLAVHYSLTGKPENALMLIDSAITVKKQRQDIYGLAIAFNEKASIQLKSGSWEDAYRSVLQSLEYSKKINDRSAQADSYHLLQKYFRFKGNYDRALRYNGMAFDIATAIEDKKLITENYRNLAEIFREKGNFREAYHYFTIYNDMKDSLVDQHQLNNIYTIEFRHQLEKQQGEISMLREKQEIQALKIERQELILSKRNLQMFLIAGGFLLVILFLYMRYMRSRHRYQREMVVALMQQKSRQAKKIIDAELNERKRISQELHDTLGQLLSLVKMNLSRQDKKDTNEPGGKKGNDTLVLVDQAITELRNITQNMSPLMLKEKGLKTAIGDMIHRLKNVSGIDIRLETHDLASLDDELIESTVYSVIQEALNNAVKHAQCSTIEVQVIRGESEVTIMVEDNGSGFSEEEITYGLGLRQVKTKVSNLDGRVEIDSMKGRGTILTVEIPLQKIFEV